MPTVRGSSQVKSPAAFVVALALTAVLLYWGVAVAVFQIRNPKANQYAVYRELPAVLRFESLEHYQ